MHTALDWAEAILAEPHPIDRLRTANRALQHLNDTTATHEAEVTELQRLVRAMAALLQVLEAQ